MKKSSPSKNLSLFAKQNNARAAYFGNLKKERSSTKSTEVALSSKKSQSTFDLTLASGATAISMALYVPKNSSPKKKISHPSLSKNRTSSRQQRKTK